MADASNIETQYIYKIYREGVFLGVLQNVVSEFNLQQDIKSAGCSINVEIADSPDGQFTAPEPILDETGTAITDELGATLLTERQQDIVGNSNSQILVRNNNDIVIYEVSSYNPSGVVVFSGWISKWSAKFGGSDNVSFTCISYGSEFDNYLVKRQEDIAEIANTVGASTWTITSASSVYIPLAILNDNSVGNISKVSLRLASVAANNPTARLSWRIKYGSLLDVSALSSGIVDGYDDVVITSTSPADYEFTLNHSWNVAEFDYTTGYLAIGLTTTDATGINAYYNAADVNPLLQIAATGFPDSTYDPYMSVYYQITTTTISYSNYDPTAMLREILDNYALDGGTVSYTNSTTTLTGLSDRSYTFKMNTVLEGIKKCAELSPYDFYWYVDPATSVLYFKQLSTTPDHTFVYGKHFQDLNIINSAENIKTEVYFTGGDVGDNVYLLRQGGNSEALDNSAGRVGLTRLTDNRVTQQSTADAIISNYLNAHANERYESSITIINKSYDVGSISLGQVVSFTGFNNFVDDLVLQVVRLEKNANTTRLTLGVLPNRAEAKLEEINRTLDNVATIYNPDEPV